MGHSQSGSFPLAAALLNPAAMKGLVLVEPGTCPANYTAEQIATLANVPLLVVFGDYRDTADGSSDPAVVADTFRGLSGHDRPAQGGWRSGADAQPGRDRCVRGNSHMIMQDRTTWQVADLILKWIGERVGKPSGAKK